MMEIDGVGPLVGPMISRPAGVGSHEFVQSLDAALRRAGELARPGEAPAPCPVTAPAVPEIPVPALEARVAFELLGELRTGLLESYREIQRMLA